MATGTTIISRQELIWPDFNHDGGVLLHTRFQALLETMADNTSSRFAAFAAIADSTTSELDHNLGVGLDQLTVLIYTGTEPALTRIQDPEGEASPWTIAEKTGEEKTVLEITTPAAGGPHTFAVVVLHDADKDKLAVSNQVSVAANITLRDKIIHMVDTSAARTLTLPSPDVRLYIPIKDVTGSASTNNITIATPAAETIDGDASYLIDSDYMGVAVVSDGTNYFII